MTPRFHPLKISDVRRETADAISVCFEVPSGLEAEYAFRAGQHLTFRAMLDGEELRRSYSICSGIDDGCLRVAIKRVAGGRFSNWAIQAFAPGKELEVMTPDGLFSITPDAAHRRHYAAFAAGSGITPILSIIKSVLAREPESRFTLVYGNRRLTDTLFLEELEELKDRYLTRFTLLNLFSRETQEIDLFSGRLNGEKIKCLNNALLPVSTIDAAFVCGPGEMIDDVESALVLCGLAAERIHVERFGVPIKTTPSTLANTGDAATSTITVEIDGTRRTFDYRDTDASLVDSALAAGIDLPYSCKGGMCCTCRARLIEGKVRMARNYSLEQTELDEGFVLTCQAHPLTNTVTLSFDQR